MTIKREIEFNKIVSDILKNEDFIKINKEIHHGISRMDHSLNVAKTSFTISKTLNLRNYQDITRASLLHDFFLKEQITKNSLINHPDIALINAKKNFKINELEENIIVSHMFPIAKTLPKYKESYLVSFSDKIVATYECIRFKFSLKLGTILIFMVNFLSLIPNRFNG